MLQNDDASARYNAVTKEEIRLMTRILTFIFSFALVMATVIGGVACAQDSEARTQTALDERESSQNNQQEAETMIEDTYSSGATYSVTIRTNKGDIEADLYNDIAGIYVRNFVNLARSGFYDGSPWHRVIPGFVIQGGQNAEGRTVPQFADEFHPDMKHDSAGILSMANAGFNTNTSQFFITHDATPHLDPYENGAMKPCEVAGTSCHAVFGKVTTGMDIVLEIEQGDVMESVEIHEQ